MSIRSVGDEARLYFVPYILGNSRHSHKICAKIYKRFGIVSLICDERRSLLDLFDLSSRSIELTDTDSPRLVSEELIWLATQNDYVLPRLIPVSEKYQKMIECERERLESCFVISSEQEIFTSSPLASLVK